VTVETVYEDDAGDPDVALTKARRLVEEEGVQLTAGPILANTAYAVADYVSSQGIPSFHITGADDLTQRQFDPLVLRVGYTSSQSNFRRRMGVRTGVPERRHAMPGLRVRLGELRRFRERLHQRRRHHQPADLAPPGHPGLQ